jgi:hypothetical protein
MQRVALAKCCFAEPGPRFPLNKLGHSASKTRVNALMALQRTAPQVLRAALRPGHEAQLVPQMLPEKFDAARPRDVGAGLVVAGALFAIEAVLGAGIDVDLDLWPLGPDDLDIA